MPMKKPHLIIFTFTLLAIVFGTAWYFNDTIQDLALIPASKYMPEPSINTPTQVIISDDNPLDYQLEIVAENLFVPWSIVFTGENRILLTERSGAVRVVENDTLKPEPLYVFESVSTGGEKGLAGMALHPDYETNKQVYICFTEQTPRGLENAIVRLTDGGASLQNLERIFDSIPSANNHAGCRIAFGPDELLYITTGDALERNLAQDLTSLAGKKLRITSEGAIPDTNPYPNSPVYSYGHRNAQGLDWHPVTGLLYSSEHGPSVFDGPRGGDEINLILAGENYGWPLVSHDQTLEETQAPLITYTPAIAPASAHFYTGNMFPQLNNYFLMGGLVGTDIYYALFDIENPTKIVTSGQFGLRVGRIRDITTGPDGAIYFVTSNRDGRGNPRQEDDTLYRLKSVE
jgi:aldose sugar dehydrogenase